MDILYIANVRMPTEKAHGLQIAKTVEALIERGVNVKLVLPKRLNMISETIVDYYSLDKPIKIKYITIPFNFVLKVSDSLYFKLERIYFTLIAFFYGITKPDSIYSRDITICFLFSLFGKDVAYEDHEPKNSKKWLYKFFLKAIGKKVIVAKNLADVYKEFGIDERTYRFIPNGVDLEEFDSVEKNEYIWKETFNIDTEKKVALYVGHFYGWKGIYTFIDAAPYLKNTETVLMGGTELDRAAVRDYIDGRGVENVHVHGHIPHHNIVEFIKSADVLILPNTAQEERSSKYTTPIKLFEYMASRVPIVASRVESFKNYLKNNINAVMFEPDNAKDLASKIGDLLNNHELMKNISSAAYQGVSNYSWQRRAEKIINFIKK